MVSVAPAKVTLNCAQRTRVSPGHGLLKNRVFWVEHAEGVAMVRPTSDEPMRTAFRRRQVLAGVVGAIALGTTAACSSNGAQWQAAGAGSAPGTGGGAPAQALSSQLTGLLPAHAQA